MDNKKYKTGFGDDTLSKIADGFSSNTSNIETKKYKTAFGDDTMSKIADGFTNSSNLKNKKYCSNCHREITSSNYTGSTLCVECKNYYY